MKKVFLVVTVVVFLMSFTGCGVKQTGNTPSNPIPQEQTKIVKFDSTPQGAEIFVDSQPIGETPLEYELSIGTNNILIRKDGFEYYYVNIEVLNDGKEQSVMAVLNKEFLRGGEVIHFIDKPAICTNGSVLNLTYSGIYPNDTVEINGYTVLDSFDIVFPSGKKAHFDTEPTGDKDAWGKDIKKFSKKVTFDEIGEYRVMHNDEIVTPTVGGYAEYKFQVLYKAKVLNGTTMGSLNGNPKDDTTVLLPIGEPLDLKLLLTDGNGNIAKNKPIGLDNLKTDDNGVVSIRVESDGTGESPFVVYGDVACWACEYTKFDTNGNLIKSCFMRPNQKGELVQAIPEKVPQKTFIKIENGHIYMPFDCSGLSLSDLGFRGHCASLLIHPENPSIIYTNSLVSKDGGKSFENFGDDLSFHVVAIDPSNPEVVYGFLPVHPTMGSGLFKSTNYGKTFRKIADFKVIVSIVVDPKNSRIIYITTDKELLKSSDDGKTWKTFFSCFAIPWINHHNTDVILTTVCNFAGTKDGGKSWANLNFFKDRPREWNEPVAFAFDPVNQNVVYGITHSHLFKSEDNGDTWTMLTSKYFFDLWSIAIDPTDPQKIYLGCNDGILASVNGGKTFSNLTNPGPYVGVNFSVSVIVDANGNVYSNNICGIPLKLSESSNWLPLNSDFIDEGPQWKVINGVFYVDVKTIKSDTAVVEITKDRITFYRLSYMGP